VNVMVDPEFQKKVLALIENRRDAAVAFLRDLVSIPSVTGDELDIQKFIAGKLREMGLELDIWEPNPEAMADHPAYLPSERGYSGRPNVVGIRRGSGSGRSLILNGHVDVIPAGPLSLWKTDPWRGEIEDDRLYGRGASDMKSGLAAMTLAVDALIRSGVKCQGDLILQYTVDEEATGNGTLACVLRGYKADAGICCETSSLHVQPACIGRIWFEILVRGRPAGIQRRAEGINAIEKGYAIMNAVADLERIRIDRLSHPLYPDKEGSLPCMVGVFQSGSFPSAFPDTCLLKGSIASLPGEETPAVKREFIDHLLGFSSGDPWLKEHPPEVTFKGYCGDPAEIAPDHPIVLTLCESFRHVTDREPNLTGRQGAADTRYLIKYGQTPTVIFGPGPTEQMHATNEWVGIDDLMAATKVMALSIMDWCGCC
jgi:acetylornithine deacetylase